MKKSVVHMKQPYKAAGSGRRHLTLVIAAILVCAPALSQAYVGPGAGITMLGALWAVFLAVIFVLGGVLLWPIRTLLRRRKGGTPAAQENDSAESSTPVKPDSTDA